MMADRPDQCFRRVTADQRFADRGLRQAGIFQRGMNHARLRIKQEDRGHPSRCPMRQRKPLPLREPFQPVDERFFSRHFDVGRNDRSKRYLHEVEGEQVPHQRDGDVPRRAGMLDHGQLHLPTLHDAAVPAQAVEHQSGQITLL